MPFTEADLEALKQAYVDRQGARSITFADQSATFDGADEMRKLFAFVRAEIALDTGKKLTRLAAVSKGC